MAPTEERKALSPEEIGKAVEALTQPEKGYLMKRAKIHALGTDIDPKDLISEAILRTIDGRRKCPDDVRIVTFLANVIKSIASHRRHELEALAKDGLGVVHPVATGEDEGGERDPIANAPGNEPAPDASLQFDELRELIETRFANDQQVQDVLSARLQGFTKEEACELFDMAPNDYDAAVKRLRRTVEKEYGR